MEVRNALATQKYTKVFCEDKENQQYGAPHHFEGRKAETGEVLQTVDFQCGPIKECGVNGLNNEDLLLMVLTRLNAFQDTEFKCRENALAITKIEESLMWLRKRTTEREMRNVEGTHTV